MIERCDDTAKSKWLSMLFKELVLGQNNFCLFMRAEKVLSSLSVMDMQTFLKLLLSTNMALILSMNFL